MKLLETLRLLESKNWPVRVKTLPPYAVLLFDDKNPRTGYILRYEDLPREDYVILLEWLCEKALERGMYVRFHPQFSVDAEKGAELTAFITNLEDISVFGGKNLFRRRGKDRLDALLNTIQAWVRG